MFGFRIDSKGKRVLGRKTQRAASNCTTCPSGCSPNLVDGGCFSQAKIDRSACNIRLSPAVGTAINRLALAGGIMEDLDPGWGECCRPL
jgi:hypothetical protein